jgi:catechol-2,3-dioxygenase
MKLKAVVLDSSNSEELSNFYQKLLGWTKCHRFREWIIISSDYGEGLQLTFQEIKNYERPVWPVEGGQQQQMMHLDFYVDDLEDAIKHAISCGAELSKVQFGDFWRVMLDPAGHPFCLAPNKLPSANS